MSIQQVFRYALDSVRAVALSYGMRIVSIAKSLLNACHYMLSNQSILVASHGSCPLSLVGSLPHSAGLGLVAPCPFRHGGRLARPGVAL